MRLGVNGSVEAAADAVREKYGHDIPQWVYDRGRHVGPASTLVTRIAGPLGFYEDPTRPLPPVVPTSHREAPTFEGREQLIGVAESLLPTLLETDVVVTAMPFSDAYRTTLTLCRLDPAALEKRLRLTGGDRRSLATRWETMQAYWFLREHAPMTREEFVARGPRSNTGRSGKWFNWLDAAGFLLWHDEYATAFNVPIHVTAHAVELVVDDWAAGLEQARRTAYPDRDPDDEATERAREWAGYAEYAWVGIDAAAAHTALANREQFEQAGIGLIGLDRGGAMTLLEAERLSPPRSRDREYLNEKTLRMVDVDQFVGKKRA